MDPDLFISIAFSSLVFLIGVAVVVLTTVIAVHSRRTDAPTEARSTPSVQRP